MQAMLWALAGASAAMAMLAALADRRRSRRRDLDRVGWVPWPLLVVVGVMLALAFAAFAIRG